MAAHNEIGHLGEDAACAYLQQHGYAIVERNWRLGNIEIDIIAENGDSIVFVEVKTRTTLYGDVHPEQYVDVRKKKFMTVAGNAYIKHLQSDKKLRFDICGILWNKQTNSVESLHYYKDAFYPKLHAVYTSSFNGQWRWKRR